MMYHEVKRIRLEVCDLNLASTGGPSVMTIILWMSGHNYWPGYRHSGLSCATKMCGIAESKCGEMALTTRGIYKATYR